MVEEDGDDVEQHSGRTREEDRLPLLVLRMLNSHKAAMV